MGNRVSDTFRIVYSNVLSHLQVLYDDLDQVKVLSVDKIPMKKVHSASKYHWQYLFPFLVGVYVLLDSATIWAANGFRYSHQEMPQLFTHLINPRELWKISDVTMGLGLLMLPTIFGCLMIYPKLEFKYQIYMSSNKTLEKNSVQMYSDGKLLNNTVAIKIYQFRRLARRFINLIMAMAWNQAIIFYICNFIFQWTGRLRDYWMLFVVCSFYFYAIFANIILLYYFALSCHYINIKQKYTQQKLHQLTKQLGKKTNIGLNAKRLYWFYFKAINRQVRALYAEIQANNRFWSVHLTIYFSAYIFEIVYFTYATFYISTEHPLAIPFNLFFVSEFCFTLLMVTMACSAVGWKNRATFCECRRFCVAFNRQCVVSLSEHLKMDLLVSEEKVIKAIAFRLLNNFAINTQMLELLISYITLLFLMLVKNKQE